MFTFLEYIESRVVLMSFQEAIPAEAQSAVYMRRRKEKVGKISFLGRN